jgi:hypothetical protein
MGLGTSRQDDTYVAMSLSVYILHLEYAEQTEWAQLCIRICLVRARDGVSPILIGFSLVRVGI